MKHTRLGIFVLGLAGVALSPLCADDRFDIITALPTGVANVSAWKIDCPNVKQPSTSYPTISFQPGDWVSISAGGCVQTGGHGKTWKRYVNPLGPDSDRLYHGCISIPSVTNGLVRIVDFGQRIEFPVSQAGSLQLGYEDDGYGDNGYYARNDDNGTDEQCKGLGNAFVVVAVRHGGSTAFDVGPLVGDTGPVFPPVGDMDIISKVDSGVSNVDAWRIDKPNVKQAHTSYPMIFFRPGDYISVYASGCVQTGGHGKTWKRYVNPLGANADRLYHGLIAIPGLTHGPVRLRDFGLRTEHQLPMAGALARLQLGYEDDGFDDNGYYARNDDNGTDNQCAGLGNAFLIVAIRHGGDTPFDAGTLATGIDHAHFLSTGSWPFQNRSVSTVGWDAFNDAFNLGWDDYLNPLTYGEFAFGDVALSNGLCEGMCLLADAGADDWVVGGIEEPFWPRYRESNTSDFNDAMYAIRVCHWRQLSRYFLEHFLHSVVSEPGVLATQIEDDVQNGTYGLLALVHGFGGHVLVPLSVERTSEGTLIHVYDPNRPFNSSESTTAAVKISKDGSGWSFVFDSQTNEVWGSSVLEPLSMAYIPYERSTGWTDLANGADDLIAVVFGEGSHVSQVTDGQGRKLFARTPCTGLKDIDISSTGLGKDVLRVPSLNEAAHTLPASAAVGSVGQAALQRKNGTVAASAQIKPPLFTTKRSTPLSPAMAQLAAQRLAAYRSEAGKTEEVYLVSNRQLQDLKFTVTTAQPGAAAHMTLGNRSQYYSLASQPAAGSSGVTHAITVRRLADLADGVTVEGTHGEHLKITGVMGTRDDAAQRMVAQTVTINDNAGTPVSLQVSSSRNLEVRATAPLKDVVIETVATDRQGQVSRFAPRTVRVIAP